MNKGGRQTQAPVKKNRAGKSVVFISLFLLFILSSFVVVFYSFRIQSLFSCEVIAVFNNSTIFCFSSRVIERGKPEASIIGNGFGLRAIRKSGHINRIKGGKLPPPIPPPSIER